MNSFLRRWIPHRALGFWGQCGVAAFCALLAALVRFASVPLIGLTAPYVSFFPAIVVASVFGGATAGLMCTAISAAFSVYLLQQHGGPTLELAEAFNLAAFAVSGGLITGVTSLLRQTLIEAEVSRRQEQLLALELHHRVKNTLATVQSLASQSLGGDADPAAAKRALTDRLIALSDAHNLLGERSWRGVEISAMAERILLPFRSLRERITIEGDEFVVPPNRVVGLCLCVHELASNAAKYGALSDDTGRVQFTWTATPKDGGLHVVLSWSEHDGPPVLTPARKGFGSRLLGAALGSDVETGMEFSPLGLRWSAAFDLQEQPVLGFESRDVHAQTRKVRAAGRARSEAAAG